MKNVVFLFLILFGYACQKSPSTSGMPEMMEYPAMDTLVVSTKAIQSIITNIPSPLETTTLLQKIGVQNVESFFNELENIDLHNSNLKKALNLGIYGTDLGFINIFEKNHLILAYLKNAKRHADDLKIGQFFDFEYLSKLASNANNSDSLLYQTTRSFQRMDEYLNEDGRGNLSVLILTGGWVEALYIALKVSQTNNHPDIIERIGAQKTSLKDLITLCDVYKNYPGFSPILDDLTKLDGIYDGVKIVYEDAEPTFVEVDGILQIKDESRSIVTITPAQIEKISKKVEEIRSKLIK